MPSNTQPAAAAPTPDATDTPPWHSRMHVSHTDGIHQSSCATWGCDRASRRLSRRLGDLRRTSLRRTTHHTRDAGVQHAFLPHVQY